MTAKLKKIILPRRKILLSLSLACFFLFLSAKPAQAFVLNQIAFGIAWLISMIAAIGIALEAWLLSFVLQINTGIINSPVVAVGFPIALSFANLLLVFAIVVIAIMTILRIQTYGMKQTLWKLIVMAIAINFGLVIAGAILQFSDSLSFYFINTAADPTGGESNGFVNTARFASAVAGAFQPQQVALLDASAATKPENKGFVDKLKAMWKYVSEDIATLIGAELLQPIAILVFTIFFLLFMIITLGALIVMLVIRYVYVAFLLVILPLAWAMWIFPLTNVNWYKWWKSFLRQTFFLPLVLFFLWVAIQTSYALSKLDIYNIKQYQSPSNPVWAGLSGFFTNLFAGTFQQFLQLTVILGVMLFGIFAANSMGIKFADAAAGAAKGAAKGFGGWAARKTAGAAARTTARAMQPPGTAPRPTGWRRYNPFSWAAYGTMRAAQATVGRVAQTTGVGRRTTATLQSFGEKAAQSPGLVASIWGGMKSGSGLFKEKKKKKVKGRTATGEVVEVETDVEEEEAGGAAGGASAAPGGARPQQSPIVTPAGTTGSERARDRRVLDEQTGEMVSPEELEQRREDRDRAAFEQRRGQTPPAPPEPPAPTTT